MEFATGRQTKVFRKGVSAAQAQLSRHSRQQIRDLDRQGREAVNLQTNVCTPTNVKAAWR